MGFGKKWRSWVKKDFDVGLFRGVPVGFSSLRILHLQFADDMIVFSEANIEMVRNLKRILRVFEVASGPALNLDKSKLFGIGVEENQCADWAASIKCEVDSFPSIYLGLPLGYRRSSTELWKSILEKLPSTVASKLNKMIAKFLWGSKSGKAIHWVKWDHVCKPKEFDGLGFTDLKLKNRSLINKWIWRFGVESSSLWRRVIEAKYGFDHASLIPKPRNPNKVSWVRRSISCPIGVVDDAFTHNVRCVLGDGSSIEFWDDFWTDVPSVKVVFPRIYVVAVKKTEKINAFGSKANGVWSWYIELRRVLFEWEVCIWNEFMLMINAASCSSALFEIACCRVDT
ncbi:uncharacterized protein LOC120211667 [Hibiscus syriacus]|uniref:uncharacterized protein LOC120211667 n=1 Tax=Hibiscus syriacus TaxID=106335 RepID=UPI00192494F1|nr:uncharacterized protein LOC120211667 [Hibiscus syriacus]